MKTEPQTPPEELRRRHLIEQAEQDRLREIRQKRFRKRWIGISALVGMAASFSNYFTITWLFIPHAVICSLAGYLIVKFRQGHLSSAGIVAAANVMFNLLIGWFNPFGALSYALAGAFIGLGVTLERDMR